MGCIKISAPHTAKARHGYTQYWARIILIYRTDACLHTLCKICKHAIFMNLNMYSYTTLVHLISYLFRYHFCIPITSLINTAYIKSQKKERKVHCTASLLLHCSMQLFSILYQDICLAQNQFLIYKSYTSSSNMWHCGTAHFKITFLYFTVSYARTIA